jgi:phytoene synthase
MSRNGPRKWDSTVSAVRHELRTMSLIPHPSKRTIPRPVKRLALAASAGRVVPLKGHPEAPKGQSQARADERWCEELTRREAKNFYWGFIALSRPQRLAIYALYSFARQVDDAVDGGGGLRAVPELGGPEHWEVEGERALPASPSQVADRLAVHRERLKDCFDGAADDPVTRILASAVTHYGIPRAELEALIDGVEMDLRQTRYQSWDELHTYCRHVASSVGRMCVRIFGYSDPAALEFADDLGVAMQLANILRDVREDSQLGRIYLPLDELHRFGISEQSLLPGDPGAGGPVSVDGWDALVRHEISRAEDLFESGLRVSDCIPRRPAACVFTMAGIYQAIVREIAADPYLPLRQRVSLDGSQKLSVMFKSWLQAI